MTELLQEFIGIKVSLAQGIDLSKIPNKAKQFASQ